MTTDPKPETKLAFKNANKREKKKPRGKPFVKDDPRAKLGGRPIGSFNDARKQFLEVLNEILKDDKGNPMIDAETGEPLTRGKARMRLALSSRNPKEFEMVMAYAVGKPKDEIELSGMGESGEVIIKVVREDKVNVVRSDGATTSLPTPLDEITNPLRK